MNNERNLFQPSHHSSLTIEISPYFKLKGKTSKYLSRFKVLCHAVQSMENGICFSACQPIEIVHLLTKPNGLLKLQEFKLVYFIVIQQRISILTVFYFGSPTNFPTGGQSLKNMTLP
jgi:hypothetical protein